MPARLSNLKRALTALGLSVTVPNKGSHWKVERDGKVYPIPAHNAEKTEISDTYIRGVCRAFNLDESELRKLL